MHEVASAADQGLLDLSKTKVWCEKPVAPTEVFDEVRALAADKPDLDVSVGYILRFSETLVALQDHLEDNDLTVTGLQWIYGKDRTNDPRPTQGVFPDEIVHPLSVTDLVLSRVFGEAIGVDVESADMQRRPFANPEVQEKAHANNPAVPLNPTSDVTSRLEYAFNRDGSVTKIPVSIETSFLMPESMRRVYVSVSGTEGNDVLVVDFDTKQTTPDGQTKYVDRLTSQDGTLIYEWDGDKSTAQVSQFLRGLLSAEHSSDMPTSLERETTFQGILQKIGEVALEPNTDTQAIR